VEPLGDRRLPSLQEGAQRARGPLAPGEIKRQTGVSLRNAL
jgi:hypothetical protein